jgi:sorting nexin-4
MGMSSYLRPEVQADAQTVAKHHHISHPPPDSHLSMMDSLSDTFINAFSKVRKPDARFVEMSEELERFEEGLTGVERLVGRGKNRVDGELPSVFRPYKDEAHV